MTFVLTIQNGRITALEKGLFETVALLCNRVLFGSELAVSDREVTLRLPFGSIEQKGKKIKKDLMYSEKHLTVALTNDTIVLTRYCTDNKGLNKKVKATEEEKAKRFVLLNKFLEKEALDYRIKKSGGRMVITDTKDTPINYQTIEDKHIKNLFKMFMTTYEYSFSCAVILVDTVMLDTYGVALQFVTDMLNVAVITSDTADNDPLSVW